jgi:hypothetical protein
MEEAARRYDMAIFGNNLTRPLNFPAGDSLLWGAGVDSASAPPAPAPAPAPALLEPRTALSPLSLLDVDGVVVQHDCLLERLRKAESLVEVVQKERDAAVSPVRWVPACRVPWA